MTDFLKKFEAQLFALLSPGQRLLVATSGGVDSVVLCHLCHKTGVDFAIGHVNFQLRGAESDDDQKFVEQLGKSLGAQVFIQKYDTKKEAVLRKKSIQEAARGLRYEWLETLRAAQSFDFIATAHHLDDSVETFLYNFSKGTGIRGLTGIPAKRGRIIRPLLIFGKTEILAYAKEKGLNFREDSSNSSDKYARNLIRQKVVPALRKVNPGFVGSAAQTMENLRETRELFAFFIRKLAAEICEPSGESLKISKSKLDNLPAPATVLFEILSPFGFNADQGRDVVSALKNQPGALFLSATHQLLNDREWLFLTPRSASQSSQIQITEAVLEVNWSEGVLKIERLDELPVRFDNNPNIAYFDAEKITFPLTLRRWKPGDTFAPFGMRGKHQKLQDLFSNLKLSRFDKEKTWLLLSEGAICWVVGLRNGALFPVTQQTKSALKLEFCQLSP